MACSELDFVGRWRLRNGEVAVVDRFEAPYFKGTVEGLSAVQLWDRKGTHSIRDFDLVKRAGPGKGAHS